MVFLEKAYYSVLGFFFPSPPRCLFFFCICSQESHCAASTFVSIVCVSVLCKISYTREVKSTVMQVVNKYGFADAICLVNKEFCYCNIHSRGYFLWLSLFYWIFTCNKTKMAWKNKGLGFQQFLNQDFIFLMRRFQIITAHNCTPQGVPPIKIQACMRVLGCVSSYGNVWKPHLNQLHCVAGRKAGVETLKRWAVPEKMRSCGAIEMHESGLVLGQ